MEALAITHKGIEDIACLEISELVGNASAKEGCVVFSFKKYEDLFLLSYKTQSISKILLLFDSFHFNDDFSEKAKEKIKNIDVNDWINAKTPFVVRSFIINNENFASSSVEPEIGEYIIDKTKAKVDLENPLVTFFVYIYGNTCYLGIDFSGDLGKRNYKIFNLSNSLKGSVAYALARIADVKEKDVIMDPFAKGGEICIETALFLSNLSVNYYCKDKFLFLKMKNFEKIDFDKFFSKLDKRKKKKLKIYCCDNLMNNIQAAKKNAKIAGVHKDINFSRNDLEWLDVKFKKKTIDKIITYLPFSKVNLHNIKKVYKEFFYQAEYILKDKGKIVVITEEVENVKEFLEQYKFKIKEKREVWQGQKALQILVIEKG